MREDITRDKRLEYLTIGFCIMALYHDDAIHNMSPEQNHRDIEGSSYSLFNSDYVKKYMSLAWSLARTMIDPRTMKLGSLGTHVLEHFFGNNRRINHGNDTAESFERTVAFQLLSTEIQNQMNLSIHQKKRVSTSGATLQETAPKYINPISLEDGMKIAYKLIRMTSVGSNFGSEYTRGIIASLEGELDATPEELLSYLPALPAHEKSIVPSLNNIGVTKVGGLTNDKRNARHQEIFDL